CPPPILSECSSTPTPSPRRISSPSARSWPPGSPPLAATARPRPPSPTPPRCGASEGPAVGKTEHGQGPEPGPARGDGAGSGRARHRRGRGRGRRRLPRDGRPPPTVRKPPRHRHPAGRGGDHRLLGGIAIFRPKPRLRTPVPRVPL